MEFYYYIFVSMFVSCARYNLHHTTPFISRRCTAHPRDYNVTKLLSRGAKKNESLCYVSLLTGIDGTYVGRVWK